uniref:ANF_receptor domain-containing protein n=1 Tax=Mesocestoides corti TaxID=53468 RepID=A0A5K3FDR5_MESCO
MQLVETENVCEGQDSRISLASQQVRHKREMTRRFTSRLNQVVLS